MDLSTHLFQDPLGIQSLFFVMVNSLPRWHSSKESACQCRRRRFDPWVGNILWRGKWQPTPVVLPGKFHGWRRLGDCSPGGHKESNTAEHTHSHTHKFSSGTISVTCIIWECEVLSGPRLCPSMCSVWLPSAWGLTRPTSLQARSARTLHLCLVALKFWLHGIGV